jgi:hypothetical protein
MFLFMSFPSNWCSSLLRIRWNSTALLSHPGVILAHPGRALPVGGRDDQRVYLSGLSNSLVVLFLLVRYSTVKFRRLVSKSGID